jgi:hypothetical protein
MNLGSAQSAPILRRLQIYTSGTTVIEPGHEK